MCRDWGFAAALVKNRVFVWAEGTWIEWPCCGRLFVSFSAEPIDRTEQNSQSKTNGAGNENAKEWSLIGLRSKDNGAKEAGRKTDSADNQSTK